MSGSRSTDTLARGALASGPTSALLLLADSRLPVGAHAHGAGAEAAVAAGRVRSVPELVDHLQGGLFGAGLTAAALAAAACALAAGPAADVVARWDRLDDEADERIPAKAAVASSRAQGRSVLRLGRDCWPDPAWGRLGAAPHHAVALGVAAGACGGDPRAAAALCAAAGTGGPASAALRLLRGDSGDLDDVLARLAPSVEAVASRAAQLAARAGSDLSTLPRRGAPMLDIDGGRHTAR